MDYYPHEPKPKNPFPILEELTTAKPGDVFLLREPDGRQFRAVVLSAEEYAIVIHARTGTAEPNPRAFALNGFELGAYPAAEIVAMPEDKAEAMKRKELYFILTGMLELHGENALPAEAMEAAIHEARRFQRRRAEQRQKNLKNLERALKAQPPLDL